jgi:2'-5' RNA ligase
LQSAIETASAGFTAQERQEPFSSHLTLGRIKSIGRPEAQDLARLASAMARKVFGQWTADRVEIMRSELSSNGARHTILATAPLAL